MTTRLRFRQLLRLSYLALRSRRGGAQERLALFQALIAMGGLYVKFAQLLLVRLSADRQNLAHEYGFLLKKAYDETPYEAIDVRAVLQAELGDSYHLLNELQTQPFAAGSFGQVYWARLRDGQPVAIKVQRPSVRRTIDFDMRVLRWLIRLAAASYDEGYDLRDIFGRFERVTRQELDYQREAAYAAELHERYVRHSSIVIPKTHAALSTAHIITQDYIDGLSLTDVLIQKDLGVSTETYVQQTLGSSLSVQMIAIGQTMLESMLTTGTAHGDPHPGNIKLLPGDRVALLDFGICAEAPHDRGAFFALVKQYQRIYAGQFDLQGYTWAIIELFVPELTSAVRSLDRYSRGQVSQQIFEAMNDAIAGIYASSGQAMEQLLANHKFMKIFGAIINENNRFGFKIKIEQPEFIRATLLFISVVEALGIKEQVLLTVYSNVVHELATYEFPLITKQTAPDQAVTVIAEWLDTIASKDVYLYHLLTHNISWGGLHV